MMGLRLLDVVAVREDMPTLGLVAGQVGTVVEVLGPGVFEVEFSDQDGHAYAMARLDETQLMALHYEAVSAR